jgi:hypothetical protein
MPQQKTNLHTGEMDAWSYKCDNTQIVSFL